MASVALVVFAACTSRIAALRSAHEATDGQEVAVSDYTEEGTYKVSKVSCDVWQENLQLYGHKLHTELCDKHTGCSWWDACEPYQGECPHGCTAWRQGVQKSRTLRMYEWAKRKITDKCPRVCRYTDKMMVRPSNATTFMATSTAFLSVEAPKLQTCTAFSLSCRNKLTEISSVLGMVSSAIENAQEMAKDGRAEACQSVLPGVLAEEIGESIVHVLKYLERLGAKEVNVQIEVVRKTFSAKTWAEICEGSMQAPSDLKMSEENMTKLILKASNGTMTEAQAAARAHAVQTKGMKAVADEIIVEQEKALAAPMEEDSLMQVDGQMEGIFQGMTYLVASIVARVIWTATYGVFYTLLCTATLTMKTADMFHFYPEYSMVDSLLEGFWPLGCAVKALEYGLMGEWLPRFSKLRWSGSPWSIKSTFKK